MELQDFLEGNYVKYDLILTMPSSKLKQLSKDDLIFLLNKVIREADFWRKECVQSQTMAIINDDIKQTYQEVEIIKLEDKA